MKLGVPRIAKGLNIVLKTATALDPAMPVMLSPYFSEQYTVPSALGTLPMWQAFFAAADFREGDILEVYEMEEIETSIAEVNAAAEEKGN